MPCIYDYAQVHIVSLIDVLEDIGLHCPYDTGYVEQLTGCASAPFSRGANYIQCGSSGMPQLQCLQEDPWVLSAELWTNGGALENLPNSNCVESCSWCCRGV